MCVCVLLLIFFLLVLNLCLYLQFSNISAMPKNAWKRKQFFLKFLSLQKLFKSCRSEALIYQNQWKCYFTNEAKNNDKHFLRRCLNHPKVCLKWSVSQPHAIHSILFTTSGIVIIIISVNLSHIQRTGHELNARAQRTRIPPEF